MSQRHGTGKGPRHGQLLRCGPVHSDAIPFRPLVGECGGSLMQGLAAPRWDGWCETSPQAGATSCGQVYVFTVHGGECEH